MNKKELKEIRLWAKEQQPVFVVGPERSGTSLLFQQVSNHQSFCDFSQATVETFVFIKPWLLLKGACRENYEMREYLKSNGFSALQDSMSPVLNINSSLDDMGVPKDYLNSAQPRKIWLRRCYEELVQAFFYYSWKTLGQKRLVEKTPAHVRCISTILETFPKAKILVSTREPLEIIASHKKRLMKEVSLGKDENSDDLAWLRHSPQGYLDYFKFIDGKISDALIKYPQRVKVVPYGDLTEKPETVLQDIFHFLGESSTQIKQEDSLKRVNQAWDPLLNQSPQKNKILASKYLKEADIELVNKNKFILSEFWR